MTATRTFRERDLAPTALRITLELQRSSMARGVVSAKRKTIRHRHGITGARTFTGELLLRIVAGRASARGRYGNPCIWTPRICIQTQGPDSSALRVVARARPRRTTDLHDVPRSALRRIGARARGRDHHAPRSARLGMGRDGRGYYTLTSLASLASQVAPFLCPRIRAEISKKHRRRDGSLP